LNISRRKDGKSGSNDNVRKTVPKLGGTPRVKLNIVKYVLRLTTCRWLGPDVELLCAAGWSSELARYTCGVADLAKLALKHWLNYWAVRLSDQKDLVRLSGQRDLVRLSDQRDLVKLTGQRI